ncbi:amino acid adenylation domain-containing protein [Kitasatospora sp. NPDC096204]|uniref:amino acid adenylation domain-containing protein n=1 Tax=Kitasatospora sp. NPDC096204 TaxID=3364094 RepID=UPI003816B0BA
MKADPTVAPDSLDQYLSRTAERLPDGEAVVGSDGRGITFRELHRLSAKVAAYLSRHGVGPGDRVGLLLPKSPETVAVMLGTLRAGAAYVPIDANGPAERAAKILSDCAVRVAFTTPDALLRLDRTAAQPHLTPVLLAPGAQEPSDTSHAVWADVLAADEKDAPRVEPDPDRLAYLLYTSGSTGTPKGVAITHRNAVSFVEWASAAFAVTEADRLSGHAPFHFDLSVFDVYAALRNGAGVHLIDTDLAASPRHLARFVSSRRITIWYSAPAILGAIGAMEPAPPAPADLRLVLFAGEPFPPAKLRRIKQTWPGPDYFNLYGPTETNVCTYHPIPDEVPDDRHDQYPIGAPCSHCDALLVDEDHKPVDGEEGFLAIAGPSVFPGYWRDGRPVQAASHFTTDDGRLWYDTGDVVRREGGVFVFRGRRDRMVKRHGYRIELDEIEKALAAHPELSDAAVVSTDSDGQCVITAFIVAPTGAPSAPDLKRYTQGYLPRYMLPDRFQALEELPRTSTGKTDYRHLEGLCQAEPTSDNENSSNVLRTSPARI